MDSLKDRLITSLRDEVEMLINERGMLRDKITELSVIIKNFSCSIETDRLKHQLELQINTVNSGHKLVMALIEENLSLNAKLKNVKAQADENYEMFETTFKLATLLK